MKNALEMKVIDVIQGALRDAGKEGVCIAADDSMDTVSDWDSVSFMSVFIAINEAFGLNPDFDDAIHYTSVDSLCSYLRNQGE